MPSAASRLPPGSVPALLLLVGIVLRAPALGLPLLPQDAVLAEAAERLAQERWPRLEGQGPLLPFLVLIPTASGAQAGWVLRLLALAAGALAPLALRRVALGLGLSTRAAALAALLLALHPVLVAHAGGPEAGAQGLALLLLLAGLARLVDPRPGTRRLALVWTALAPAAWPAAWPYLLTLAPLALAAERRAGPRALLGLLATGSLALGLTRGSDAAGSVAGLLLVGLPAAGLLVLLPFVPRGLGALVADGGAQRPAWLAWAGGTLLHLLLLAVGVLRPGAQVAWDGARALVLVCAPLVLLGVQGLVGVAHGWRLRVESAALLLALTASLLLGLAPAQAVLLGTERAPAGRLSALAQALRLAVREAGPEGWVALDLGEDTAAQARAARPWLEGRPLLVTPQSGGPDELPRGWPAGGPRTLALVTVTPLPGTVTTLGGLGIFAQEAAGQAGPYHVFRVRRP